jgi:hypothetical protein
MSSRYNNRDIKLNKSPLYKELLDNRGIRKLQQYTSANVEPLTSEQAITIEYDTHVWKTGSRLYKLSERYYGNAEYWWLIAWYNNKPTESHFKMGDVVYIPLPFERILSYYSNNVKD